jgi:site-specific recombinase XerD
MSTEIINLPPRQLSRIGFDFLPPVIARAGESASRRFIEFFTANIRNKNTRKAYVRALADFLDWCEARGIELKDIQPVIVAAYIEGHGGSKPTVKQHQVKE